MKSCSNFNCKQSNPQSFSEFYKNKSKKDGLGSQCKTCERALASAYRKTSEWKIADARRHKKYEQTSKGKANHRRYLESPKGKSGHSSRQAKRRADKLRATPKWSSSEHSKQIKKIYEEAAKITKETGIQHDVDHIIPLKAVDKNNNRIASGLHVPWNLQILPAGGPNGNRSKRNKIIDK